MKYPGLLALPYMLFVLTIACGDTADPVPGSTPSSNTTVEASVELKQSSLAVPTIAASSTPTPIYTATVTSIPTSMLPTRTSTPTSKPALPTPIVTNTYTATPIPTSNPQTPIPTAILVTPTPAPIASPTLVPSPTPVLPTISLLDAVAQGNVQAVRQNMDAGTDPNLWFVPPGPAWAGASALHLAVINRNKEIAQLLIDSGANKDIKAQNQVGGTPLHWAAFFGIRDMAEFMVNVGADLDAKDNVGCSPICATTIPNPYVKENDQVFKMNRSSIQMFLMMRGANVEGTQGGGMRGYAGTQQGSYDTGTSGGTSSGSAEQVPELQNLLIKNLGPYDAASSMFGDLRYITSFDKLAFDPFGYIHNKGQPGQYDNPTFEFKAPADTLVIAPASGKLFQITWQPSAGYTQDDWEIMIRSSKRSEWGINIDHIVSIDCDRSGKTPVICDKPLRIGGQIAKEGMVVEAGQVLGYVGNWPDYDNTGINGRTELTLYKYLFKGGVPGPDSFIGVMNYCPTMYLANEVESEFKTIIAALMNSYETWSGNTLAYEQEKMIAPGCLYSAIKELDGKTEPVTE